LGSFFKFKEKTKEVCKKKGKERKTKRRKVRETNKARK